MSDYRPPTYSMFPLVVKNLLIANGLFFVATWVLGNTYNIDLNNILGLHYFGSSAFKPYQLVTYMFMHGGIAHILFNMFALWMFGNSLENFWGPKRFLLFYFVCGIGAGITQEIVQYFYLHHIEQVIQIYSSTPNASGFKTIIEKYLPYGDIGSGVTVANSSQFLLERCHQLMNSFITIGASGAIYGILLAFGMLFPNTLLYIYFAIPVKAKYVVTFYGLMELFFAVSDKPGDDVAHYAHLGGMVFGFFLILYWRRKRSI
jgi:membrane associated rhomboid family serine protease